MPLLRENSFLSALTTADRSIGNRSGKNTHNQKNNKPYFARFHQKKQAAMMNTGDFSV
jgi:hypothetical protein